MKSDQSPSPQDSPLSIVHQPSSAIDPAREPEYLEAAVINVYPQAKDVFFTPRGIQAMVIFLIANSLLSLNQWLTSTTPTPRKAENSPLEQRQNNSRHLDRLIAIARPVQKTPQTSPIVNIPAPPLKTSPITNITAPPVVQSPPTAISPTNALLPPNPPPSPMPAHQLPVSKLKQSLPVAPPDPGTPPVSSLVSAPPPPPVIDDDGEPETLLLRLTHHQLEVEAAKVAAAANQNAPIAKLERENPESTDLKKVVVADLVSINSIGYAYYSTKNNLVE
jgi:hypothetical protein